ncbi:MAG: response regulator [Ignavibacteria bacterium]|nr:response regulator [Ignavibacteria bacterium]
MAPSNPITLMFVDDDAEFMNVVQHLLAKHTGKDLQVIWKKTGLSAIEELEKSPDLADFVFLDYTLPDMDGLDLARRLREKKITTPVILLTSQRDLRIAIDAIRSDIEDYVVKDEIIDSTLARTLMNVVERVKLRRQIADQQKADLLARRKTDAIKELVVTVCHEFNNPLAAMKISANILSRQKLTPQENELVSQLDGHIRRIEAEITKLRELNIDKFDLSKLE